MLIILATVSIYAVLGENGLIQKAQEATGAYEKARLNEEAGLGTIEEYVNSYMAGEGGSTPENPPTPPASVANAATVAENPAEYYGKVVSNYTVADPTFQTELSAEGVDVQWQIFHSDGNNIYLIASNYIPSTACPDGKGNTGITENSTYKLGMNNVRNDYAGSADITDNRLKALNKSYFVDNNYSSTNNNMKAVAYMMDTSEDVWGKYANNTYADYAIGGPTLEMFLESYNKKHDTNNKYQAQADSSTGYKISVDSGANWNKHITNSADYLDTTDNLYIISSTSKANYAWFASPSANDTYSVMIAYYDGRVAYGGYGNTITGFRPVVCLKSNVQLTNGANDTYTLSIP